MHHCAQDDGAAEDEEDASVPVFCPLLLALHDLLHPHPHPLSPAAAAAAHASASFSFSSSWQISIGLDLAGYWKEVEE